MKNHMMKDKQSKYIYWCACVVFGILILVFLGKEGPSIEPDTRHFIDPTKYVKKSYPLYTTFLECCRMFFGESVYMCMAFVIQSLLAYVTSFALAEFLRKYFSLRYMFAFCVFACTFLPYTYPLPESMVNHHILTEAIAFPLFSLYLLFVLRVFLENNLKRMFQVGILTVLIILCRSQLLLMLPVYVLLWGIILLKKIYCSIGKSNKKIFWSILTVLFGVTCVGALALVLQLIGNGSSSHTNQLTAALSGRVLCVIDEEDREVFEGEEQDLYDYIFTKIDENKSRYPYFQKGIKQGMDIMRYTNANTYALNDIVAEFYEKNTVYDANNAEQVKNSIISKLFINHLLDYLYMTLILVMYGLTMAVFFCPFSLYTICHLIALGIYIVVGILLWYANYKIKIDVKYSVPMLMTFLLSVCIIVITNIIFYGQQRYVIYTFGSFYFSLLILLLGIYRAKHVESKDS